MGSVRHGKPTHDSGAPSSAVSRSGESVRALAWCYGMHPTTVQKGRNRTHCGSIDLHQRMGPNMLVVVLPAEASKKGPRSPDAPAMPPPTAGRATMEPEEPFVSLGDPVAGSELRAW